MYAHQGCRSQWRNNRPTHLPGSRVRLLGNTRAVSTHRGNPVAWKMACAYRTRQGRGGGRWVLKPATGRECGHPCETRPRVVVSLKGIPNDATYFSLTKGRECKLAALERIALSPKSVATDQACPIPPLLHSQAACLLVLISTSFSSSLSPLSLARSFSRSIHHISTHSMFYPSHLHPLFPSPLPPVLPLFSLPFFLLHHSLVSHHSAS